VDPHAGNVGNNTDSQNRKCNQNVLMMKIMTMMM